MGLNRALFLDRDGVVNVEKNYVHKIEDFEFIDGIFELCKHYEKLGFIIVIITNQSGIARGFYGEDEFAKLSEWMIDEFAKQGVKITKIYHCPHHPDIGGECDCRKPKNGMILRAKNELNIDLEASVLVGDSLRDIEAALSSNIKQNYLFDAKNSHKDSPKYIKVTHLKEIYSANIK